MRKRPGCQLKQDLGADTRLCGATRIQHSCATVLLHNVHTGRVRWIGDDEMTSPVFVVMPKIREVTGLGSVTVYSTVLDVNVRSNRNSNTI